MKVLNNTLADFILGASLSRFRLLEVDRLGQRQVISLIGLANVGKVSGSWFYNVKRRTTSSLSCLERHPVAGHLYWTVNVNIDMSNKNSYDSPCLKSFIAEPKQLAIAS